MYEIKLRAWDLDKKEMLIDNTIMSFYSFMVTPGGHVYKNGKLQNVILMLYTGLKDKNNKEIYDGDILRYKYDGDMFERGGKKIFLVEKDERSYLSFGYSLAAKSSFELEIIGNKYENPELLKELGFK